MLVTFCENIFFCFFGGQHVPIIPTLERLKQEKHRTLSQETKESKIEIEKDIAFWMV